MKVKTIPIDKIDQNENSRVVYKAVDLSELMSSIKQNGLLQPIGVRETVPGRYETVFGNRRLLAAKKLDWTEIECHVLDIDDDIHRDILGLIENLKRQNTSVAEDGRMFMLLKDRGLSIPEIAARLGISETRVNLAIQVVSVVPEEFRKSIVYRTQRQPKAESLKNKIPASSAMAILTLRRSAGLNRAQTRSVFKHVLENGTDVGKIQKITPLMKGGATVGEAIEAVSSYECITLSLFIDQKNIVQLEKKHGKKVRELLYDHLLSHKEFKIKSTKYKNFGEYPRFMEKSENRGV